LRLLAGEANTPAIDAFKKKQRFLSGSVISDYSARRAKMESVLIALSKIKSVYFHLELSVASALTVGIY